MVGKKSGKALLRDEGKDLAWPRKLCGVEIQGLMRS